MLFRSFIAYKRITSVFVFGNVTVVRISAVVSFKLFVSSAFLIVGKVVFKEEILTVGIVVVTFEISRRIA